MKRQLLVLTPSAASIVSSLIVGIILMALILTPVLENNTYFAQYIAMTQSQSSTFWEVFLEKYRTVHTADIAGTLSVFSWWAIMGVLVLYLVRIALSVFLYIETVAELLQFKQTNKKSFIAYLFAKLLISIAGILGIAGYAYIFFKIILSFISGFVSTLYLYQTWIGVLGILLCLLGLMLALHIFVILLRITFLRLRLFSWVTPTESD